MSKNISFLDAVKMLNENGNGFLAIVDRYNKLLGILTDGDIRSALLDGKGELEDIFNKNPMTMPAGSDRGKVLLKMRELYKKHMPLVDQDNVLIDVVMLHDEEFNLKPNWVVIMAGGLGERLGELTRDIPKPMLKVGSKPLLEHIINNFILCGFTKFIVSVNYKSDVVKNYFGDGSDYGVEIKYIEEGKRLGTAGSLSLIDCVPSDPFFVINGDVYTSVDFSRVLDYHNFNNSDATMCVRANSYSIPYGVLDIDKYNNILGLKEKPEINYIINAGIYILSPDVLNYLPKNEYYDMPSLFSRVVGHDLIVKSFMIDNYWIDMGNPEDYRALNEKVSTL